MEQEIINRAKEILASADTGTNDCKIYNDGFLDGVEYAIKALNQQLVRDSVPTDEDIAEVAKVYDNSMSSMSESIWMPKGFKEGAKWMRKMLTGQ